MKLIFIQILLNIFLILCATLKATEVNRIFLTQNRFYGASLKALADAGIAFPSDISSGFVNPALTFSSHQSVAQTHGTISTGYGQDTIFDRLIMPLGVTYSTSEGALGLFYRFLKGSDDIKQHEVIINIAGQMFSKSDQQGAVDFGINFRFEKLTWNKRPSKTNIFFADDSGHWINKLTPDSSTTRFGSIRDKRFLLDIGFYQPQIFENLDFGLTMRNLIGYVWTYGNIEIISQDTLRDSFGNDSVMIQTVSYTGPKEASKDWTKGINRTLSAGIVYHTPLGDSRLMLNFPIDFEIMGLFDKHVKNRCIFKGGIEAEIGSHFALRFGYSRAPGKLRSTWEEIKNINIFTGGAGLKISPVACDFYITQGAFGITASFDY